MKRGREGPRRKRREEGTHHPRNQPVPELRTDTEADTESGSESDSDDR